MTSIIKSRIASIDLLKGFVMIIMAIDHTREYFHAPAFLFDPGDPGHSSLPIFFTRFITHFCAPAFSFLAGISAFMAGQGKPKKELSTFLLKRGVWLVVMELTVVNFGWYFDVHFRNIDLLVLWSLGISMMALAGLIYVPRGLLVLLCCLLIFGHNLLDTIHFKNSIIWGLLHEEKVFPISGIYNLYVGYPVLPWIAVMALGYCFGLFYLPLFDGTKRRKLFNTVGAFALLLFILLRITNLYGDERAFVHYHSLSKDMISFFNPTKYPPSLLYLLMTLGTVLIFLANSENVRGKAVTFFSTFGKVPFFYYILHIYFIHGLAMLFAQLSGFGWQHYLLTAWTSFNPDLQGYGYPLWVVYVVWISIIALLYPLCKKFAAYKQSHKENWWLSYL
ncbi:DUF1624 domain-containing protein [Spirosoma arboris]|nr:heparan-alpha-glucosaminide N-acetyltransferase domain-containing protein [Spirosoma arboris]